MFQGMQLLIDKKDEPLQIIAIAIFSTSYKPSAVELLSGI